MRKKSNYLLTSSSKFYGNGHLADFFKRFALENSSFTTLENLTEFSTFYLAEIYCSVNI